MNVPRFGSARRSFALLVMIAVVAAINARPAAAGPFPVSENFRGSTASTEWTLGGSAVLTASSATHLDSAGQGWLRLTGTANNTLGYARNDTAFPTGGGLVADFQYATYGGTHADGLMLFMWDGATPTSSFRIGQSGGNFGYKGCASAGQPGLGNAYVGIAFDEYGNFVRSSSCLTGFSASLAGNRVGVRGSEASNYAYLTSAPTAQPIEGTRALARRIKVMISSSRELSVFITYPDGQMQTVLDRYVLPAGPPTLKFGFAATTGGSNNIHEIRQAQVAPPADLATTVTDGATGAARGDRRTWTATVVNDGPNSVTGATVKATAGVPSLANVSWTCAGSAGGSCGATSGTGVPDTTADLPVGGRATYTIGADAAAATDYAQMRVVADTAVGGDSAESDPTDNAATDATDLTPVADTVPTASLGALGVASQVAEGTWRGGSLTMSRQWQRCTADGATCTDISGATGTSYTVAAADAGGTLRLRVRATNAAGSTDAYSTRFSLPDTAVTSGPSARTRATGAAFVLSHTGPAGTSFECRVDDDAWAACATPTTLTGLAPGQHTFRARAVFGGLLDPTPAEWTWTVDTSTSVHISTPAAGVTANRRPTVSGLAEAGASLVLRVDGADVATGTAAGDGSFVVPLSADLPDGDHAIAVLSTDDVGNSATDTVAFTIDTVAPGTPETSTGPAGNSSNPEGSLSFTGPPGSTFRCRVDDGAWTPCTSPYRSGPLSDGTHTIAVVSVDSAGNESVRRDHTWTVDTTPPAPPTVLEAPAPTAGHRVSFSFSVEPSATLECALDGGEFATCPPTVVLTGLRAGRHELRARQVDPAGNVGAVQRISWLVEEPGTGSTGRGPHRLEVAVAPRVTAPANAGVDAGCAVDQAPLGGCTILAFHGRTPIGYGRRVLHDRSTRAAVRVKLNAAGRRLVGRALGGLPVRLEAGARSADGVPLHAGADTVVYPERLVVVPTVNPFRFDSARLRRGGSARQLRQIAADLRPARLVTCTGYTDSRGRVSYNRALGMRRARAVCTTLGRLGVHARLVVRSAGERRPRSTNATRAGRLRNRRVDLGVEY